MIGLCLGAGIGAFLGLSGSACLVVDANGGGVIETGEPARASPSAASLEEEL